MSISINEAKEIADLFFMLNKEVKKSFCKIKNELCDYFLMLSEKKKIDEREAGNCQNITLALDETEKWWNEKGIKKLEKVQEKIKKETKKDKDFLKIKEVVVYTITFLQSLLFFKKECILAQIDSLLRYIREIPFQLSFDLQ